MGCHNGRTLLLGRAFPDRQAALWYSLINPLTAVWRLIRAVMSMASLGSCTGGVKGSASVGAMMVVVALELGKDGAQVPFTVDQQIVEAFAA